MESEKAKIGEREVKKEHKEELIAIAAHLLRAKRYINK